MSTEIKMVEIKDVQFLSNWAMLLSLSNDRTFIIPLEKFNEIAALTDAQRKDFEVIDGKNLSFIALDEIYSLQELIGM